MAAIEMLGRISCTHFKQESAVRRARGPHGDEALQAVAAKTLPARCRRNREEQQLLFLIAMARQAEAGCGLAALSAPRHPRRSGHSGNCPSTARLPAARRFQASPKAGSNAVAMTAMIRSISSIGGILVPPAGAHRARGHRRGWTSMCQQAGIEQHGLLAHRAAGAMRLAVPAQATSASAWLPASVRLGSCAAAHRGAARPASPIGMPSASNVWTNHSPCPPVIATASGLARLCRPAPSRRPAPESG